MVEINSYLNKWGLAHPITIAETKSCWIYEVQRNSRPFALKVFTSLGAQLESRAAQSLKAFRGRGAVHLIDCDAGAALLEFLDGPKLSSLVEAEQDQAAALIVCDVLDQLHYVSESPSGIPSLEQHFSSLLTHAKQLAPSSLLYRTAKVTEELIETEGEKYLLHGDIHHANILQSSERGWLAIDPQSLYSERTYDVANSFFNPDDRPDIVENPNRILSLAEIYSERLNVDRDRILKFAFAHGGLSISWQLDDGEDPRRRIKITELIETLL